MCWNTPDTSALWRLRQKVVHLVQPRIYSENPAKRTKRKKETEWFSCLTTLWSFVNSLSAGKMWLSKQWIYRELGAAESQCLLSLGTDCYPYCLLSGTMLFPRKWEQGWQTFYRRPLGTSQALWLCSLCPSVTAWESSMAKGSRRHCKLGGQIHPGRNFQKTGKKSMFLTHITCVFLCTKICILFIYMCISVYGCLRRPERASDAPGAVVKGKVWASSHGC